MNLNADCTASADISEDSPEHPPPLSPLSVSPPAPSIFPLVQVADRPDRPGGKPLPSTDPWQINTFTANHPILGLGTLTGLLGVLLAFFWLRIRQLNRLVERRDRQIEQLVGADALTGLPNLQKLRCTGQQLLSECPQADIALLSVALDRHEAIKNALGQDASDTFIKHAARRLQLVIGSADTLARTGRSEFTILLNPGDRARACRYAKQVAEQILEAIARPFHIQTHTVRAIACIGIALASTQNRRFCQLLTQAEIARFRAKSSPSKPAQLLPVSLPTALSNSKNFQAARQRGQGCYLMFEPAMQVEVATQAKHQRALGLALSRQELRLHYQPIVDLKTAQTVGFEALVRWQHPTRGLLYPGQFLPLAEDMGLTIAIDRWVLQAACQQLIDWQYYTACSKPYLSINLSGAYLSQPDLVEYIRYLLACYPICPEQINLEITESVMIANPERAIKTLEQLKALGIWISLDDFGTGYSSLRYLHQFPVDVLKIDRAFVRTLGARRKTSPQHDEMIVQTILALAEGLSMRVVAEGIEQKTQFHQLRKMRCGFGQGYFFYKPMPGSAAQALLNQTQQSTG